MTVLYVLSAVFIALGFIEAGLSIRESLRSNHARTDRP